MRPGKFIYWTPRILSIVFILFLSLFSFDVFSPELGFWQIALALLIHNIPALFLLAVLLISWRYEIFGGIVFILAGLVYIALVLMNPFKWYMISWFLIIALPAFFIGALFLIGWYNKR
ncbi:MAG TPA: hypothetical protein VFF28_02190 [Candidatus Nanoarchaeia archaeon]|nr:hypothetical protein [Candidatus Nanoarchaeia archaeon]